jgi:ABC-type multidrug transport system ATPase subunit
VDDVTDSVQRAVNLLDLAPLANVPVDHLSRGQQQRAALARAIVHDPTVLLLDEPDAGLDPAAIDSLERLVAHPGRTTVMTTHRLDTGVRLADRVAVFARGALVHEVERVTRGDTGAIEQILVEAALQGARR